MVTRVRVEARANTPAEVVASLDWACSALGIKNHHEGTFASSPALSHITEEVIERKQLGPDEITTSDEETDPTYYIGRRVVALYPVIALSA